MNKININILKTYFIIIILGIFIFPGLSLAYQKTQLDIEFQNDFVVEPGKTEIFLNKGESVVKNIIVTNRIRRRVGFRLSTEDLVGTTDPSQPVILMGDTDGPYSLRDFIEPEIYEFILEPGERIIIPVKVSVPEDAEPRGYYGALIVSSESDIDENGEEASGAQGKTKIISRIGSLFLVKINGQGQEEGRLEDFKISGPLQKFYSSAPESFEIAYENTGNVHLVPYGKISINNLIGRTIDQIAVDAYFVLPDSIRYREVFWQDAGFMLGRYKAELSLYKGYNNEYESAEVVFWVLPWRVVVPVFIGLVLLISIVYYVLTRFEIKKKN
jgi:hypothetical protein